MLRYRWTAQEVFVPAVVTAFSLAFIYYRLVSLSVDPPANIAGLTYPDVSPPRPTEDDSSLLFVAYRQLLFLKWKWWDSRPVDSYDAQFRNFTVFLPLLVVGMFVHVLLWRLVRRLFVRERSMWWYCWYQAIVGVAVCIYLHGKYFIPMLAAVLINYAVVFYGSSRRYSVVFSWVFNFLLIVLNGLGVSKTVLDVVLPSSWYAGILGWEDAYRFIALKNISYAFEQYWAPSSRHPLIHMAYICYLPLYIAGPILTYNHWIQQLGADNNSNGQFVQQRTEHIPLPAADKQHRCGEELEMQAVPDGKRVEATHTTASSDDTNTLNSSSPSSKRRHSPASSALVRDVPRTSLDPPTSGTPRLSPTSTISPVCFRSVVLYGLHLLLLVILMQFHMRYVYVYPIAVHPANFVELWPFLSPLDILFITSAALVYLWLKFIIIWRFFRLWALMDGIYTVENMQRCVGFDYSTIEFWRHWHSSFYRWLLRYLYIPLGGRAGRGGQFVNVTVVFVFVAIWHEVNMKLLLWGGLVALFVLPELLLRDLFSGRSRNEYARGIASKWYFKWLCAMAGGLNVFSLCLTNLVGYSFGPGGLSFIAEKLLGPRGLTSLLLMLVFFISKTVVLMYNGEKQQQQPQTSIATNNSKQ
eukprot:GHVS01107369.1.p1 GENE.GHVS01107369.1~~GHVS01107369.1.p1  ORF type:complete len:639 (+),score=101.00 GHVS01107369.1:137-2053(+)